MKKTLLSCLALAFLLGTAWLGSATHAQSGGAKGQDGPKPLLVVSISGYDKVLDDVGFLGRLAQQEGLQDQAKAMITLFTQGKGLQGLDPKRPWGVVINNDGGDFQPVGFVPVTDMKALVGSLMTLVGPAQKYKDTDIIQVDKPNQPWYLKEVKGWAFISPKPDNLAKLPADPTKWLDGLDKQYEVAVRFYINNVPEVFRGMAIDRIKDLSQSVPMSDDDDEETKEKKLEQAEKQAEALADLINTIDQITLGWAIDQSASTSHLDLTLTAIPGSQLAQKLGALKETTSNFTGFMLPKAAATLDVSQTLLIDDIEQIAQQIDSFQDKVNEDLENSPDLQDDESRAAAKRIMSEACEAIKDTIKTGKIDLGGSWLVGDRQFSIVVGGYIKQPEALEKAFNDLVEIAKKDANFPAQKFDLVKDGDMRFHTFVGQVPPDEEVTRVIGKELKGVVGFGPQSVYFAVSTDDPMKLLKRAIADSKSGAAKKVSPGVVDVALQQVLDFASVIKPDDETTAKLLAEVAKTPGKDHIHLEIRPQTNGVTYRLELQEGVLKVIGLNTKLQMQKQGRR